MNNEDLLHKYEAKTTGQILKDKRQSLNIDLEHIARHFKIPVEHLTAIENDDEDSLPPRVYALGFVKSYASFLDLDEEEMVSLFKMQTVGRQVAEIPSYLDDVENDTEPNLMKLVTLSVACLMATLLFYAIFSDKTASKTQSFIAEIPEELGLELLPSEQGREAKIIADNQREDSQPSIGDGDVRIKAFYDVWIEIKKDDGGIVFSGILKAGKTYETQASSGLYLTTGNAGGMTIFLGDKKLKLLGDVGKVVRNIPLDTDGLKGYLE